MLPHWLAETADGTISHVTLSRLHNGRYGSSESKVLPLDNPQSKIKKSGLSTPKIPTTYPIPPAVMHGQNHLEKNAKIIKQISLAINKNRSEP